MPRQTVTKIVHGVSNGWAAWPFHYSVLGCGHAATDPEAAVGSVEDCGKCEREAAQLAQLIAFTTTPEFSHLVARCTSATPTPRSEGWWCFIAYRRDPTSPTGVWGGPSVVLNERTEAALAAAGLVASIGPTRGPIAEGRQRR